MTLEPTTDQRLASLRPGHVIVHDGGRYVVHTVSRAPDAWSVAARPAHRDKGPRKVFTFQGYSTEATEALVVPRLATAEELAAVRDKLREAVQVAAKAEERDALQPVGDAVAHRLPPSWRDATPEDVAEGEAPLVVGVRVGGTEWKVEL